MSRKIENNSVGTSHAPAAIGPYSQAFRHGDLLFVSGQIGLDPKTGKMAGSSVEAQTIQAMQNLGNVLGCQGLHTGDLVKTTIFLASMDDFAKVNTIYERFVQRPYPARATVEVSRLPLNALVEIEAIACYCDD